ncbi:MAG: hypothetical protein AAGM36_01115 [Cyanobacteria bacterium J06597_1]
MNWELNANNLIKSARLIILDSEDVTPGVEKELELILKNERQDSTFILKDNDEYFKYGIPKQNFVNEDIQSLSKIYNKSGYSKPLDIKISSFWVVNEARDDEIQSMIEIRNFLNKKSISGEKLDRFILADIYSMLFAKAILLEDFYILSETLYRKIHSLKLIPKSRLKNRNKLIFSYLSYFMQLKSAFKCLASGYKCGIDQNIQIVESMISKKGAASRLYYLMRHRLEYFMLTGELKV